MTIKRALKRALQAFGILLLLAVIAALFDGWRAFGTKATGERRARMEKSAQWRDGHFENPQPLVNDIVWMMSGMLRASPDTSPKAKLTVAPVEAQRFAAPPASGLRVTWFGHSSTLVEIDGLRLLTDPAWSERVGPVHFVGPTRWYPPPFAAETLPPIDAVLISHDHFDHLDYATVVALSSRVSRFVVPLGIGAHLEYWGIPRDKIVELDWWEQTTVGTVAIHCTPARHASGRFVNDKDGTLWASWSLIGPQHRVFFSGDTGLFPAMKRIGEELGPFDLTMIEVGQYHGAWPDWHIGPEQAVEAHQLLRGKVFLPIHWGLFALAYHSWTEPIERAVANARVRGATIATPRPNESFEPQSALPTERWWPEIPWQTAAEAPIVSGNAH